MSLWQKFKSGVKKFFGIGGGSSGGSRRSSGSRSSSSSISRASRVSNYGGGGSRSYSDYSSGRYRSDYEDRQEREKRQRQTQARRQQATTDALASISKRTDALASGRSSSPAASATHATSGQGTARVLAKINEKGKKAPPDPKVKAAQDSRDRATAKLKQISNKVESDRKSFDKATGNKYNANTGNKAHDKQARINQKMQLYDLNAEKWEVEHHPIAMSVARGALSGVTFGASELMAQTSKDRKKTGAEQYYQKHKNKWAELGGEVAGSLVGFGLTGQVSPKLASKVAPKMLKEGGEAAAKRLAKSAAFRTAAKKEAERTGIKVTEEVLERFANQRARRLVNAVGADMAINATTGLGMDVSYAGREALDENGNFDAGKFARNYATNRALSYGLGGLLTVAPALRTSRGILRKGARADALDLARRITAEPEIERLGRHLTNGRAANALSAPRIGESLDDTIARRATQTAEQNAADRQMQQMRQSMRNTFAQNADDARRVDMGEILNEQAADTRRAFMRNADEADRALDNGFVLNNDARRMSTIDPTTTRADVTQMANRNTMVRDANRQATLDNLLFQARARADEAPRGRRDLGDLVNLRNTEDVSRAARLDDISKELDEVSAEIRLKRNDPSVSPEELDALNGRFQELLDERNTLENAGREIEQAREAARRVPDDSARPAARQAEPEAPKRKPTKNEQRRDALQAERDEIAEQYNAVKNDASVPQGEKQVMLDDMQELDLEIRDLDSRIKKADARRAAKANKATPPQARATEQTPNINEGNVPRTEPPKAEAPRAETPAPRTETKVEPPKADANVEAPKAEAKVPKTKEEAIKMARESQTREESEKLLRDYFDANDEVDLGIYGKVSKNADGTYKLSIDGARDINLTKAEVQERIKNSTKRAYEKPREVKDIKDTVYARNERPSFRERLKKAWGMGRQMISDSLASFEDTERAIAKSEGRQVDYGAINEVRAHQAKANRSISNRQLDYQGNKIAKTVKRVGADGKTYDIDSGVSLVDIYKGMSEDVERDFDLYLTLRHAPDRLRQDKSVFENIVDSRGLNFDDAKVCNAEADRLLREHPEFAEKAEQVYQYAQNELRNRVDAGLLTEETLKQWNEMYPHYVPTGRQGFNEIHGISGQTAGASEIRGATGSDRNVLSIRDQLSAATTRNWRDISTNEMFRKYFGDNIAKDLAQDADGGIERVLDNTINLGKKETGKTTRYYADIYIEGKKHTVDLEERFYEGLKDLYKNGRTGNALVDTSNEAFSKVAGVWKNLITEWSPIFMVKNGMRDFPEAVINSRQTKEFLSVMPDAMRDLMNGGPCSEALRDAGISQSTFIDIDKAIRAGKDKKSLLARANTAVEMYPRLCEYMATLKKANIDVTSAEAIRNAPRELKARAAANAADVTVNFGRSGSIGKMINKGLVPFFNPSVQGWSKFVRNITEQNLKSPEGVKQALSFAVKATALGAGATTVNNFLLRDNPNYQQISARDKGNNIIIPLGDPDSTDTFVKIPNSRFATVYGLPSVNAFNENKMGWAEAIKVAKDQVAPIDPLESTLFSPFLAARNNKTWYGTPIVSGSLEDLPPSEQYDANTSWLGKMAGKATENLPRELQISPKKADYIIDAETGIIGDFLLPALTPSRQGGGKGIIGKAGPALLNVPKRAFTIDSTTQNDLSTRFYDRVQDATTNSKSAKATPKDAAELKRLNAYKSEISTLTTAMRDLQAGDRATKQEDIRGLQEVRNKLMQDALDGKKPPSSAKAMDAVQKYVGTSYAIDKFGSSADKEAMKVYGASVYGDISEKELAKKIDADKDFYKGVRAVGQLEDKLAKATGNKNVSNLSKAVALAEVGASDELFGAYEGTKKSRTETDIKMNRARNYIADGGSTKEFVKLEKARKTLGKLSDYDKEAELDSALADLKSGKINEAEYYQKQGEIKYNANISYVGLATSLAQANAPSRGYVLYDIKAKNVQKGINLAAMGFTARDYREMAKAVDADGNGYPKKQEIIDYVNSRDDIEDKATLYDALYYYKSSYNPFGTPTNYTREQASEVGKSRGVEQISDEKGALKLKDDESSKKSGYRRRYGRRRWRRWRRYGGGSSAKATVPKPKAIKASSFAKGEALGQKKSSSSSSKSSSTKVSAPKLERVKAKIALPEAKW